MRAVDTNVLVRLIAKDDSEQVRTGLRFMIDGAWISHLVLAETVWVLRSRYKLGHDVIAEILDSLLRVDYVTIQDPDIVLSALDLYRAHPSLGFSDCLVLELARRAGHLPLGTFDRNLGRLDGAQQL